MDNGRTKMVDLTLMNNRDWQELMSVIIQALHGLGHAHTAQWLNSDIELLGNHQSLKFANLRTQFLGGFWEKCADTLCSIDGLTQENVSGAMSLIFTMWLNDRLAMDANFSVSKILENQHASRLSVADRERVARIRLMKPSCLNIFLVALELRKMVLKELELRLPCLVSRLDKKVLSLIKYGISAQVYSCLSHNKKNVNPLYCDLSCDKDELPAKTIQILTGDTKIWTVKFSHHGLYLASGSVDSTAIIWEVLDGWELRKKHVLQGHSGAITCVSWSPNDELLLTCAYLEHIKIWDVLTGQCTRVISDRDEVLRSCVFLSSDPIEIVYGTSMPNGAIRLLRNESDSELVSFPHLCLNIDFAVTPDGRKIIYYDPYIEAEWFTVKHIDTGHIERFKEEAEICGLSVCEDTESLILNLSNDEIRVWDLKSLEDKPLTYWDFKQIIGGNIPRVGGVESSFLVNGTQDSKVCIWNRRQARPIAVLNGHTSVVRSVSWNPQRPQMLASASDDNTIRIWGPQSQEVPQLFRHD